MNNIQLYKKLSVIIRLVLILILTIYIAIDWSKPKESIGIPISIGTEQINSVDFNYEVLDYTDEEMWVNTRYNEYKNNLSEYSKVDNSITIEICGIQIQEYSKVSDLVSLGFNCINAEEYVYSFGELYGNLLEKDDFALYYSCKNDTNSSKQVLDCYVADMALTSNAVIKIDDKSIQFGDNLSNILDILEPFNIIQNEPNSGIILDDKVNVAYVTQSNWRIAINRAENIDENIMIIKYELCGTNDNGLDVISYNLEIVNKETLKSIYRTINS